MATTWILYDGVCGFCDKTVQFVLSRDRSQRFAFLPLQSRAARKLLERHGQPLSFDSFVLVEDPEGANEQVFIRYRAALRVMPHLGLGWRALWVVVWWVPRPLGNALYNFVATRRYRWFGKADACLLPSPEQRGRFLGLDDLEEDAAA